MLRLKAEKQIKEVPTAIQFVQQAISKQALTPLIHRHMTRVKVICPYMTMPNYYYPFDESRRNKLTQSGFQVFVDASFIRQFKYHATVKGSAMVHNGSSILDEQIVYAGDFPDTTLDKIETAISCGIQDFSIHSMQPFPIEFQQCDPVLIGWAKAFHILLPRLHLFSEERRVETRYMWSSTGNNIQGVIISAWYNDMEYEF